MTAISPNIFCLRAHTKSGTNWFGRLLNLHPRIRCHGEYGFHGMWLALRAIPARLDAPEASRGPALAFLQERMDGTVRGLLSTIAGPEAPRDVWLGDRTPERVWAMLPNMPVFWIIRDGRDVLVSWIHHHLNRAIRENAGSLVADMREDREAFAADPAYFRQHPERLLADEGVVRRVARQWADWFFFDQKVLDAMDRGDPEQRGCRAMRLRYRDAIEDAERVRNSMYAFLGLDPKEAAPIRSDPNAVPGRKQEDPRAFNRKGVVGDWKNYFLGDSKEWFKEEAGEALIAAGYEKDLNW